MTDERLRDADSSHLSPELREILSLMELLEHARDVQERIPLLEGILVLVSPERYPAVWAMLQEELGTALWQNRLSDRRTELFRSLRCFDMAMTVNTREKAPADWARMQSNKGNALRDLTEILGGAERKEALRSAIACYDAALTVYTREAAESNWAAIQNNKGILLSDVAVMLKGDERAQALCDALICYGAALTVYTREGTAKDWAALQNNKGTVLHDLARMLGGSQRAETLRRARDCFDAALTVYTRDKDPFNWASAQNNKGVVLCDLAEVVEGAKRRETLGAALACYDQALLERRREVVPADWAAVQNNKGTALRDLAQLLEGSEREILLRAALTCYDDACSARRREIIPIDWAATQNNKGVALYDLAGLLGGTEGVELLRSAILCYDNALLERQREVTPADWAATQSNKGAAWQSLARSLAGSERAEALRTALTCYDLALLERRREIVPIDWATTQNNKGSILRDLAKFLRDTDRVEVLRAALACYGEALLAIRREMTPADWAMVQHNKGNTLSDLAGLLEDTERLEMLLVALDCYDGALTVYTREAAPMDWAMVQNSRGNALSALADVVQGAERVRTLQEAISCYENALLEQHRDFMPFAWARVQNNKGNVLSELANAVEGVEAKERLQEAVACYENALSVCTHEVFPAEYQRLTLLIGILLFKERDWAKAAEYLAKALDALEDLLTLRVITRDQHIRLEAWGYLGAMVAYALIQAGGLKASWYAAEALERVRARVTGEAIRHQEAQIAAAEHLAPELLTAFHAASGRLAMLSLAGRNMEFEGSTGSLEEVTDTPYLPELPALMALGSEMAAAQEIKEARAAFNGVLTRIRETIPDFLSQESSVNLAVKELDPDERLVYIASAPAGAVAVVIGGRSRDEEEPGATAWWDERLTHKAIGSLLENSAGEDSQVQNSNVDLLSAQFGLGSVRKALRIAMQRLGTPEGVLVHLAAYCRKMGVRRLILIPGGLLSLLPLHAALVPTASGKGVEPLLDVVQVSYAPSARIWAACRRRARTSPFEGFTALIVSDPQPQEAALRPLWGAKDEMQIIRKIIDQDAHGQVWAFEGEAATLADVLGTLKTRSRELTHVHFACHGIAELTDPYSSGLLLAYGARLKTHDVLDPGVFRFVTLRLAALSACQTALPGTELPDEVVGLPSGWLQAGAMSVLASLWPVSDSVTVALMQKFYELHLLDRLDPVSALWLAQRWLRRFPTWRQDCLHVGARHAAEGPEAREIVCELALARGETEMLDDPERLVETGGETEIIHNSSTPDRHVATKRVREHQETYWEHARHWAAFAIYGA